MRIIICLAACLVMLTCVGEASAQTPTPTPMPRPATRTPIKPRTVPPTGTSVAPGSGQTPTGDQKNTLICRMGGDMVWTLINQFELVQTQINGKNVRVPVVEALFDQLQFARNGAAVSPAASNLQPGSCGLANRATTVADPDTVFADDDGFTFQETVQWGNGSTLRGETTMGGGLLNFQNKQAFSMQVMLWNGVQWKVVPGTRPKALN